MEKQNFTRQEVLDIIVEIDDKGLDSEAITYVQILDTLVDKLKLNKQLTIPVVMPQLLCIDDSDFIWITKHKKYILITEDNGDYIIRDDEDDIVGVPKKHFKFIEAQ